MTGLPIVPPRNRSAQDAPRRVGVELEFAGPSCAEVAELVRDRFGGSFAEVERHSVELRDTRVGDFTVKLDMSAAHPGKAGHATSEGGLGEQLERGVRLAIGSIGGLWMPLEVTFPPLPIDALPEVDAVVGALRQRGSSGTEGNPLHAFGLHLNPDFASTEAGYLTDHLRAFALLEAWLRQAGELDATRRLTPFIDRYPAVYVRRLAAPDYRPSLEALIDDYLEANPSRNRALDMLPGFAALDPERVFARVPDDRIKPRPTFHYRLPDSRVDRPRWGVIADWNRWAMVERLAADRGRLEGMGRDYLTQSGRMEPSDWAHQLWRWMP